MVLCGAMTTLAASCAKIDDIAPPGEDASGGLNISIMMGMGGNDTRAVSDDPETRIGKVAVMLFSGEPGSESLYDCVDAGAVKETAGGYCFDMRVNLPDDSDISRLTAILACNVDASRILPYKGRSYEEIASGIYNGYKADQCDSFTLWGKCSPRIDTSLKTQSIVADVTRDRARIDVDCSKVDESVFTLSEIYIFRHPDEIAVFPKEENKLSVPSTAKSVDKSGFEVSTDGNSIIKQVYVPECDILMNGDGDPSDSRRLQRMAIVVGGSYKGSTRKSYYRIDFTDEAGKLMDVVRNHRYVAHIDEVRGPGSPTPDDAYRSISAGVSATIIDWVSTDRHIVFDGAHWFSVEERSVEVGPDKGSLGMVTVASDVDPGEWETAWNSDINVMPEDFSKGKRMKGAHFTAILPDGDVTAGGRMIFEALEAFPESGEEVGEVLHILVAKRLHIAIEVKQHDSTTTPWEDGGKIPGTEIFE